MEIEEIDSIHEAVIDNNLRRIQTLLKDKDNVNAVNSQGETPLLLAARNRHADVLHLLLHAGADYDRQSNQRESPLMAAAASGCLRSVKMLTRKGANVNRSDVNGRTALHEAAGSDRVEVVGYLLTRHASVVANDVYNQTPVYAAAELGFETCLRLLLRCAKKQGLLVTDLRTKTGMSPTMIAAQQGHAGCVALLLEYGADANLLFTRNLLALHFAIINGHIDCVKCLLPMTDKKILLPCASDPLQRRIKCENMCSPWHFRKKQHTPSPLHLAVEYRRNDILKYLLDEGMNPNDYLQDQEFMYFWHLFGDQDGQNYPQRIEFESPLGLAAHHGYEDAVDLLLNAGCRPDPSSGDVLNPLTIAFLYSRKGIVERLLAAGADPNPRSPLITNVTWQNYYSVLCSIGHDVEVLRIYLLAGADVCRLVPQDSAFAARTWLNLFSHPERSSSRSVANYVTVLQVLSEFSVDHFQTLRRILATEFFGLPTVGEWSCTESPCTLSHLCRISIRKTVIACGTAVHFRRKIQRLPLPERLLKFVAFEM